MPTELGDDTSTTFNWGGGIRFKNRRRVVFRIDVGSGREGTYLQFNFGPSF